MVTEDEQTKFFNTIFSPLKNPSKAGIKDAKEKAFGFVKGEHFGDIDNNILDLWDLSALNEEQANSWKWLRALKERYKGIVVNDDIKIHKFVWHKKSNEAGWGPKLVTEIMGTDQHQFLYVTKPMDEAKIELIKTVGSLFNLFQPVQQGFSHDVSVEQAKDFTIISVLADNGETLEKEFESILKPLNIKSMDSLFQKIIKLYLQPEIHELPSLGFVAPIKYGKEWKYGSDWNDEKDPQLKFLRDFEKTAPFIVPLRWEEKGEQTHCITLLHGDEWGGNFMAPPSDAGSIRPIDFEDAHIQRVEVELNDQKNIDSYLKPSQDQESHKTAGGSLAYRVTSRPGEAPPLHAYSAMSALGRLFAALVQKQTLKTNPQEADEWIEEVTARFFNNLRNSVNTFISNQKIEKNLESLNLDPEITRRGLMVRAVLAAYNWSEHWKYKPRDDDGHDECYEGKWKKSSLEEFQFQLGIQGEWEVCSRDSKGRPATIGHDYAKILRSEIDTYNDWTEFEQTDISTAISLLEDFGNTGIRVPNKEYRELGYLDNLLPFEKDLSDVVFERRRESTKHERLENKIDFINAHFILEKEEKRGTTEGTPAFDYFIKCIKAYPIDEHWKEIWLFWRDIYSWVGCELKPDADKVWTMQVNFDAHIIGNSNLQLESIIKTFETGTLLERDQQSSERNLILTKHIAYLNSFRKRIVLSSGENSSILLDSRIARFCSKLGELIFENLSEMDYTDLNFLTNLIRLANDGDREFVETSLAFDIPLFVLLTFAKLGFDDKTEEIEQFFDALSQSVGKCFTVCAKNNDEEDYNDLMEVMLHHISHPKQQLLRAWAIEFTDRLNPHTQRILENVPWYKIWNSLRYFPSLRFTKLLDPTSPNYDFHKRFFLD